MHATPPNWIVLKFGGTSVSRRHRWDTIGRIAAGRARDEDARVLVVVSALSGVTNALQAVADGADARAGMAALAERHREFAKDLGLDPDATIGARLAALQWLADDPRAATRPLAAPSLAARRAMASSQVISSKPPEAFRAIGAPRRSGL